MKNNASLKMYAKSIGGGKEEKNNDVQTYSVILDGCILSPLAYTISVENKMFSSCKSNLTLFFKDMDGWSFDLNEGCTLYAGDNCSVKSLRRCNFFLGSDCTLKTGLSCSFILKGKGSLQYLDNLGNHSEELLEGFDYDLDEFGVLKKTKKVSEGKPSITPASRGNKYKDASVTLKPILLRYACGICGNEMEYTGDLNDAFVHKCKEGHTESLEVKYPQTVFEEAEDTSSDFIVLDPLHKGIVTVITIAKSSISGYQCDLSGKSYELTLVSFHRDPIVIYYDKKLDALKAHVMLDKAFGVPTHNYILSRIKELEEV